MIIPRNPSQFVVRFALIAAIFGALVYTLQIGNRDVKDIFNLTEYYGLEEKLGLFILFKLRGPRDPPNSVVVVAIDRFSAERLQKNSDSNFWDRGYHAQLTNRLQKIGASSVTFDVFFNKTRDEISDDQLENEIRTHQNVILYRHLQRNANDEDVAFDPLEKLSNAADNLGVFPLPKIPERVNYFWTFFPATAIYKNGTSPQNQLLTAQDRLIDLPSLPTSTIHTLSRDHFAYKDFLRLMSECHSTVAISLNGSGIASDSFSSTTSLESIRTYFKLNEGFAACVTSSWQKHKLSSGIKSTIIDALVLALNEPPKRYLNYFGPPGSIPTISYSTALSGNPEDLSHLSGKTVFVGLSDTQPADQVDGRATVFTERNGLYVSGVEIAATAFDNLLTNEHIVPADEQIMFFVIAVIVFFSAILFSSINIKQSGVFYLFFCIVYLLISVHLFRHHMLWIPIINPLFIQLPTVFVLSIIFRYAYAHYVSTRYELGIQSLLPRKALRNWKNDMALNTKAEQVYCYCIITDIAGYTNIAESLDSNKLAALSNSYFESMGQCVQDHNGEVLFIDGDSMTIVWIADSPDEHIQQQSIDCAFAIGSSSIQFSASHPATPFPTRIGMSCGWMAAGNIEAGAKYMYRVHGDAIVTASRLESLNKQLGTTILATRSITQGMVDYACNPVGTFVLQGKKVAIKIDELLGYNSSIDNDTTLLVREFQRALSLLKSQNIDKAIALLRSIDNRTGGHKLSQFYLNLLEHDGLSSTHFIDEKSVIFMKSK